MRIACPACNAAYEVPNESLREGRMVRCVRCETDWAPIEAVPAPEPEPEPEPPPEPVAPAPVVETQPEPVIEPIKMAVEEEIPIPQPVLLPKPPPARRGPVLLVLAWVLSLAIVAAALAALYVGRERVMQVWPPSVRAYAALGLAPRP